VSSIVVAVTGAEASDVAVPRASVGSAVLYEVRSGCTDFDLN
jgi:hypothetical protein